MITKVNPYGHISLTNDYFSGLVEQAAKQCYGIAAMGQAPAESVVRSALRTGLVRVDDPALRQRLENRQLLAAADEAAVRDATYAAIGRLMAQTGLSAAAIDWFFFQNRTRCPETQDPDCPDCPVQALCARETGLFQPVYRTTAY